MVSLNRMKVVKNLLIFESIKPFIVLLMVESGRSI